MSSVPLRPSLTAILVLVFTGAAFGQAKGPLDDLAQEAKAILRTNCYRCHGQEGAAEGGFNYSLDRENLVARKKVVAGNSAQSRLFKRVASGSMPPEDEKPRPSETDIGVLKKWIDAGAPDFNPPLAQRQFVAPEVVLRAIRTDLEGLEEFDRKFTRYFTLTHLYNAGLGEDQLQTYRLALSKLVNSLSWGRRVVVPQSIDAPKTVFRIDLRHYGWNEKVWDRIVAIHPYGIVYNHDTAKACAAMTKSRLPYVRGDWFVAAAAKPPLYHDVLQLPKTDKELESQLRVDVAENIRQRLVVRAGFNSSGVSQNNRLIERHESANGSYWKSYDFAGNADRQNLFARPLGPGGTNGFHADGGEIIFSLPNGLQGYFLADAKGNRIDKGPTSIVSDPKRPDRAVVNGLSCMSCHNQGTIDKDDEIRKHVLANRQSFSKDEAETILAIYPPNKRLKEVLTEDAERFARAVEKTGGTLDQGGRIVGTDPVVVLAALFEQELDIRLAAAEAGVPLVSFAKSLERSPALSRSLGLLNTEGGAVKRDAFVATFKAIVQELKLGTYLTSDVAATGTGAAAYDNFPEPLRSRCLEDWQKQVENFKQLAKASEETARTGATAQNRRRDELCAAMYRQQLAWLEKNQPPYMGPFAYDIFAESCRAGLIKDWDDEVTRMRNACGVAMGDLAAPKTERDRLAAKARYDSIMARIAALDWNDPPYLDKFFAGCKTVEEVERRAAQRK